jgi:hypothetical protein
MTTTYSSKASPTHEIIKLGIDAHAKYYWVSRRVDGATPQPVQKMTYDELLLFLLANCFCARRIGNGHDGDGRRGVRGSGCFALVPRKSAMGVMTTGSGLWRTSRESAINL